MCDVMFINVPSLVTRYDVISTRHKLIRSIVFMRVTNRPIPKYQNSYWAARLGGMKQKKSCLGPVMNKTFLLF